MSPLTLLISLISVTATAVAVDRSKIRRRRTILRNFARENGLHFSSSDTLRLTGRIASALPFPGAAAVRIIDLCYRTDDTSYHYLFTAEFTLGVIGIKHRARRAVACTEPKSNPSEIPIVRVAPANLSILEQYQSLVE